MVFSSPVFLFLFLPLTLFLSYISPNIKIKNAVLLIASLLFYSWGEPDIVILMILMIILNYIIGRNIIFNTPKSKVLLTLGIVINLSSLVYFKYSNFIVSNLNQLLLSGNFPAIQVKQVRLPIGISFYTFQSISYLIDVYRGTSKPQKSLLNLGLYISFFPQLIAGPIVRYHDIAKQINKRIPNVELFYSGVKRFVEGLAKKIIIANPLGYYADWINGLSSDLLSPGALLIGINLFTLQLYFDFSGYSDMAIGLGRMFGFRLLENFNFPYISKSLQEFWKRWHISLSNWFLDYLYIPLGGSRKGTARTYFNLSIVFLTTGFWHGASWNYVVWGGIHGVFILIEKLGLNKLMSKGAALWGHLYFHIVFCLTLIIFRTNSLHESALYLKNLFSFNRDWLYGLKYFFSNELYLTTFVALIFILPIGKYLKRKIHKLPPYVEIFTYTLLLIVSIVMLSASTYNPFIYFQF